MNAQRKPKPAAPGQLSLFQEADGFPVAGRDGKTWEQRHTESWRVCWPEWPGPLAGGFCEANQCVVDREDGGRIYAYSELCRLLERLPDGKWLAVIEMPEIGGKPWPKNGTRLLLAVTDIWPPTRLLWPARRARCEAA